MKILRDFSLALRLWYRQNARDLPWRQTRDPYAIWLSEIILQQTRVEQGLPYYQRFIEEFPDVLSLAEAPSDQVMRLWQGLGYYSRARNLQAAAKQVAEESGGVFPSSYAEIRALKGVGDYTAAAIASFAFNLPHAVVDGNVYRVLARFAGIDTAIDTTAGKKQFMQLAGELLDPQHAAEHNQAIMELGAMICLPRAPRCGECPLVQGCQAFEQNRQADYPVKSRKTKVRTRFLNYLLIHDAHHVLVRQRTAKDIWQGLYEFPLIETSRAKEPLQSYSLASELQAYSRIPVRPGRHYRHLLSHQELRASFRKINLEKIPRKLLTGYRRVAFDELKELAFPQLLVRFLKDENLL